MKSRLALFVCLLVCLLFALPALADTTEGDYQYHIDDMLGGAVLTGYLGSDANVVVPDMLGGYPVLRLSYGLFHNNTTVESVTLPDCLQYMDGGAFYACDNLKAVYLPENLIEFSNLSSSQSFYFYVDKDSATARLMISSSAYSGNFVDPEYPSFTLYYTQSPVTGGFVLAVGKYIGHEETVIIPDGVSHIGDSAFMIGISGAEVNTWTKVVRMPSSVISLGQAALYSLPNLTEVYLSPNISSWYHTTQPWEAGAFSEGAKLYCPLDSTTFRTMTPDVTPLGVVDPGAPDFAWQSDGSGGRVLTGYYGSEPHVTIPDGTTAIGKNAFYGNTVLTSVTFPSSLKTIGDYAFYGNTALTSVTFPSSLESIGKNAFYGNTTLTSVTFPSGLESIGDYTFAENVNLTAVVLPNGLSQIGMYAFYNTKKLSKVVIPDYVHIGTCAFEYQDYSTDQDEIAKRTIYLPDNVTFDNYPFNTYTTLMVNAGSNTAKEFARLNDEWGWGALYAFIDPRYPDHLIGQYGGEVYFVGYCGSGSTITVPPFCTAIASYILSKTPNHTDILSVIVSEGVTRIEDSAFDGGWSFNILSLPSTLRYIGSRAFFATGVRTMIIPEGVTEVGEVVTDSYLKNLVLPASLTTIPDNAFSRNKETFTTVGTIYCHKDTPAAAWAKARPYQKVKYIDDTGYSFVFPEEASEEFPEEPHAYLGSGYDWHSNTLIFPKEPDIPYTLHIASANPSIVSVENDELILHAPGKAKLTVTSPELGISGSFNLTVYAPLEDFSIPEYIFTKVGTTKLTISASGQVPAAGTDPIFHWQLHRQDGGYAMTQSAFKLDSHTLPASPEVCGITATPRNSTLTRNGKLVVYSKVDSAVFDSFTGNTATGMTVQPNITVTVDGNAYQNIAATYSLTSSNTKVAKPTADGRLELLIPGTATITAKFLNGKTAKQTITVVGENVYTIARGVTAIQAEAFLACPVTIAVIPDTCASIGARAFAGCADLHRVEIPASVTQIAEDAFDGCSAELVIAAPASSAAAAYAQAHGFTLESE